MMNRNFEMIHTNGVRLRTVVEGDGPLVILLHGWPQCWYLWRHQIDPLVAAGYRPSPCPTNAAMAAVSARPRSRIIIFAPWPRMWPVSPRPWAMMNSPSLAMTGAAWWPGIPPCSTRKAVPR